MRQLAEKLHRQMTTANAPSSELGDTEVRPLGLRVISELTATALVFSGLAAVLMTAIWNDPTVAPMVFVFTLVIALSHAVLLGLPIFLIFWSRGWIGITACVVLGFAIGAVPAGILTFPVSGFAFDASAWAGGTPTVTSGLNTAAIWVSYIKPLIYLGLLGAFGGMVFWVVLMSSGILDQLRGHPSSDLRLGRTLISEQTFTVRAGTGEGASWTHDGQSPLARINR